MATFQIQTTSSSVNWTGKKVLGLHTGNIKVSSGFIDLTEGRITGGEIIIDMTSLNITDIDDPKTNGDFKAHLYNDDFFSIDKFPTADLKITAGVALGGNQYRISGLLRIKDITHPVSFLSNIDVFTDYLHALGNMTVDRTLYHIRYGSGKFMDNLGDKLIHDEFVLQFKLIGQKQYIPR